jgi:leucyl-tRNA synthetase
VMPCENDALNPPQVGFEEVERPTIIVHLLDTSTGKYALLDWHESLEGITTAIMGGIEAGQSPEEAVLMEIHEEAGLQNVRITHKMQWLTAAKYCASHKQQNRKSIAYGFLAEVDNLSGQAEIATAEQKNHTLTWVNKDEVLSRLTPVHQKLVWEQLWDETPLHGEGELMNSGTYNGMSSSEARERIVSDLAQNGQAVEKTIYKLRDWSVSRQRYWGAPIPIIYCDKDGIVLVPDDQLPVVLPELTDFAPNGDGRSALARASEWLKVTCPTCGGLAERETDTLDTYIDSSWYMLRYFDPSNEKQIFDNSVASHWMPVDFYNGADHATAHMIYARFITRFFHKQGLLDNPEPFKKFLFNGKVTAADGEMFSKSKGNGVDPLKIINDGYGADALRTYLMFAAPLDLWIRWDEQGVPGTYRFLNRVWNLVQEFLATKPQSEEVADKNEKVLHIIHPAIKKVTADLEQQKYNTAIATMMKATNELYELKAKDKFQGKLEWLFTLESLIMLIGPFAPHTAEELWHDVGHDDTLQKDHWPLWDEAYLMSNVMTIAVQVNGKLRGTVEVASDTSKEAIITAAMNIDKVKSYLTSEPNKTIYVPSKLVSFVL